MLASNCQFIRGIGTGYVSAQHKFVANPVDRRFSNFGQNQCIYCSRRSRIELEVQMSQYEAVNRQEV